MWQRFCWEQMWFALFFITLVVCLTQMGVSMHREYQKTQRLLVERGYEQVKLYPGASTIWQKRPHQTTFMRGK